jgi:hypothetical protein
MAYDHNEYMVAPLNEGQEIAREKAEALQAMALEMSRMADSTGHIPQVTSLTVRFTSHGVAVTTVTRRSCYLATR